MKSNAQLLHMYKEEKEMVIGGPKERTGLEPFPTFTEWKEEYVADYLRTHKDVSVEEADALFDAVVEEAEAELEELAVKFDDEPSGESEAEEVTPEPVKAKPAKATKKKVTKKKPAKKAPVKKSASKKKSKTEKAQKIFDRFYGKKTRAEIIEKFVAQCDLTANGASTYYQKFKKAVDNG